MKSKNGEYLLEVGLKPYGLVDPIEGIQLLSDDADLQARWKYISEAVSRVVLDDRPRSFGEAITQAIVSSGYAVESANFSKSFGQQISQLAKDSGLLDSLGSRLTQWLWCLLRPACLNTRVKLETLFRKFGIELDNQVPNDETLHRLLEVITLMLTEFSKAVLAAAKRAALLENRLAICQKSKLEFVLVSHAQPSPLEYRPQISPNAPAL